MFRRTNDGRINLIGVLLLMASVCCLVDIQTTESVTTPHTDASSVPPGPQRSLRLPNTTYPLHYSLHIISFIHLEDFNYNANLTIDIEVRESTNEIVLHSKYLNVSTIMVRDLVTNELMDDLTYSYDLHASFLIIHPIENYQAFEAGQQFRVEILYAAVMNAKTFGLYWLTYNDVNNRTVYLAATQFEPTSARLAFPCYDEPAFKSNFTIRITHGSDYMAISNMPVRQVEIHEHDCDNTATNSNNDYCNSKLATTTFHTTPPMSTYLVAFVISDFEYISEEYRGVTQRIYTSSDNTDKGQKALKNAMRTVAALEDYFGVNYPLSKLDHIALKKNYGAAMENWGLITYKEDSLIQQDDGDMHKKLKDMITQNHEIAHQWFGNLVSPEWWTYAWLNEGFATYFGYIITDMIYPELKTMEFFLTDIAERAYSYNYMNVRPMTYYVEQESEIMSVFDIISYQRAACVIKMFHHAFNQKTFVSGISKYLRKFQYGVANELQLFDTIQSALAEDPMFSQQSWRQSVPEIMLSWTHSEWIPIVTIVRNYDNDTITVRQRSKDLLQTQEHWWIPLNFATAVEPDFERTQVQYFMPPVPEVTISAHELGIQLTNDESDWLIVNKQQTGFYHVLYDDENLLRIAKVLMQNHTVIHPLNRGVIFQDLCPLIENNEIESVDVIFELLKYLQFEEDLLPWNLVADTIEFFEKNLFGTASYVLYKQFISYLITPVFKTLFRSSYHLNMTNTEVVARKNIMQIACMVDLPDCLNATRTMAHDYIFRNIKVQNKMDYYAMHDSILCLGVKYLSDDEFDDIMELLSKSERNSLWYDEIIYALRCTQSQSHLRQYLNLLFGNNSAERIMNDSDSMMYLFYLYKANMAARPVVWRFFEHHYKLLCLSPYFAENFNRISEYIPKRHHEDFKSLRNLIAVELKSIGIDPDRVLISTDSYRIGKKVKISEMFLDKFGHQIHDWLIRDRMPPVQYAASFGTRSAASRMGMLFHAAGKFVSRFLQKKN